MNQQNESTKAKIINRFWGSNVSFVWQQRTKKLFVSVEFQFIDFPFRTHVIDMQSTIHHFSRQEKNSFKIEIFRANIWKFFRSTSSEIYICLAMMSGGMNNAKKRENHGFLVCIRYRRGFFMKWVELRNYRKLTWGAEKSNKSE